MAELASPVPEPGRRRRSWKPQASLLLVISIGGMVGASARYAAELAWPTAVGAFAWTTFGVNVSGCALIGVLMVHVAETRQVHPLLRPFLGVGMLGGFTTFSTYSVQTDQLLSEGRAVTAVSYLVATLLAALAAVTAGVWATRAARRLHRARFAGGRR